MKLINVPAVVGNPEAVAKLAEIDARHPGLANAIATVAWHESGFDPAKSGRVVKAGKVLADAAGLLQWIPSTARQYGVDGGSAAVLAMPLLQQLDLAERYAVSVLGSTPPSPWALWFRGWGGAVRNPDAPDDAVMYRPGSAGSAANPSMTDASGAITVGKVRAHWRAWLAKQPEPVEVTPGPKAPAPVAAAAGGALSVWGALALLWLAARRLAAK